MIDSKLWGKAFFFFLKKKITVIIQYMLAYNSTESDPGAYVLWKELDVKRLLGG